MDETPFRAFFRGDHPVHHKLRRLGGFVLVASVISAASMYARGSPAHLTSGTCLSSPGANALSFNLYFPLVFKQIELEPIGNLPIANPSFEEPWTDDPATGAQIPNGWTFYSPADGVVMPIPEKMDGDQLVPAISDGPGEYIHKCWWQLPPEEQQGGARALILDGVVTYKAFGAHAHAIVFSQTLTGIPGDYARVNVYILAEKSGFYDRPEADKAMARVKLGGLFEDRRTFAEMQTHFDVPGNERSWNNFEVIAQFPGSGKLVLEILMQNNWSLVNTDFFLDDVSGQTLRSP